MDKIKEITRLHLICQNEGNIVSDMDGETVMLSIQNGKYYNLGEIGGAIWELIDKPITINQLINLLLEKYAVDHAQCEEQVIVFVKSLYKQGLVKVDETVEV
ncbi:lasso peptide biosynthesis PqqD family chaperone [Metabacillus litoralis]|uniref:lasso peptide biosynthesis PqqD family chaperone n=1 Tax=Metabacillus litoralis TaxID=152268 RepID=UPI001CFDF593|nr:lasso peptide biosynthesis PqqD family chaperone [Metabacillus litoralis]